MTAQNLTKYNKKSAIKFVLSLNHKGTHLKRTQKKNLVDLLHLRESISQVNKKRTK